MALVARGHRRRAAKPYAKRRENGRRIVFGVKVRRCQPDEPTGRWCGAATGRLQRGGKETWRQLACLDDIIEHRRGGDRRARARTAEEQISGPLRSQAHGVLHAAIPARPFASLTNAGPANARMPSPSQSADATGRIRPPKADACCRSCSSTIRDACALDFSGSDAPAAEVAQQHAQLLDGVVAVDVLATDPVPHIRPAAPRPARRRTTRGRPAMRDRMKLRCR